MQISPDQLADVASRLALEALFKDDYIVHLETVNAQLRARLAELEQADEQETPNADSSGTAAAGTQDAPTP